MEPSKKSWLSRLLGWLCLLLLGWLFSGIQFTKTEVAKMYRVSVKTLNKWVRYFCTDINFKVWSTKRLFTLDWVCKVFKNLGMPAKNGVLTKGQMVQVCETDYKTLSQNIQRLFRKLKISIEAYKNLDVFPPAYSQKIVDFMG